VNCNCLRNLFFGATAILPFALNSKSGSRHRETNATPAYCRMVVIVMKAEYE